MIMEKGIKLSEVYRGLLLDFQTKKTTREEVVKKLLIIADKLVEFAREEEAEKHVKRKSRNQHTFSYIPETGEEIINLKNIIGMVMIPKDKKNG